MIFMKWYWDASPFLGSLVTTRILPHFLVRGSQNLTFICYDYWEGGQPKKWWCSMTLWRLGVWNFAFHSGMIGLSAFVYESVLYVWKPVDNGSRSRNPTGARLGRHAQKDGYMGSKQSELTLWNNKWSSNILKSIMFLVFPLVYSGQVFIIWKGTGRSMVMCRYAWRLTCPQGVLQQFQMEGATKTFPWMH